MKNTGRLYIFLMNNERGEKFAGPGLEPGSSALLIRRKMIPLMIGIRKSPVTKYMLSIVYKMRNY